MGEQSRDVASPPLFRRIHYVLKTVYATVAFAAAWLIGVFSGTLIGLAIGQGIYAPGIWLFSWILQVLLGVNVRLRGRTDLLSDGHPPAIYVVNHQSQMDIVAVGWAMPMRSTVVAKKSLQYLPVAGIFARWAFLLIDRSNKESSIATLAAAAERVQRDRLSVVIFPEGTRNRDGNLLPFKTGAFYLARDANVPIVPIVVSEYTRPDGGFYNSVRKEFGCGTIDVHILDPVETKPGDVPKEKAEQVRGIMQGFIDDKRRERREAKKAQ